MRISSSVIDGGSVVVATACTRAVASVSDESDIGVAGVTGLTDESTRLVNVFDAVGMSGIPAFAAISALGESITNHWGKSYDSSQNEFGGDGRGLSGGWIDSVAVVSTPVARAAPDAAIVLRHCWHA